MTYKDTAFYGSLVSVFTRFANCVMFSTIDRFVAKHYRKDEGQLKFDYHPKAAIPIKILHSMDLRHPLSIEYCVEL